MKNKISVIIPIYKVEQYLNRCVDSVLNQTYSNLEVILVDDGSPDRCPAICDEYAEKDFRVKVIHKENGGQSTARNVGLQSATGDYVSFIDSDDWIAPDTYEYEIGLMQSYDADAVQVGFMSAHSPEDVAPKQEETLNTYEEKEILQFFMDFSTRTGSYSVWKFLYRIELCRGIKFREGKINEDIDYQYKVLARASKLVCSNQIKYYYFACIDSTSRGGLVSRDFDLYDASYELEKMTRNETYGNIAFLGKVKVARTPMSLLCKIAFYGIIDDSLDKDQLVRRFTKEIRENLGVLLRAPMPLSRKVLCTLFCISYRMTEFAILTAKKLLGKRISK
jgi:glycosyltransferase involved in cell wall biosynthesis